MNKRVSSTVTKPTKRKPNPRPRKYASASERQAAYRDRAPEVCFRAEPRTVETLDRIADTIDRSRAELLLSMTKFALTNHDWERFGLTHKTLPKYEGNPIMASDIQPGDRGTTSGYPATVIRRYSKGMIEVRVPGGVTVIPERDFVKDEPVKPRKTTKRKPTPAQLAARERFAEMARSGAFAKGRKRNPAGSGPVKMKIRGSETPDNPEGLIVTEAGALRWAKQNMPKDLKRAGFVPSVVAGARGWSINYGAAVPGHSTYSRNPARKAAPKRERMLNISWLTPGGEREVMSVPIEFTFTEYAGNVAERFFARLENGFLIVSEYSTGGRVGQVPHTMRAAALNDNAAAKQFTREMIQRIGPERFRAAIKKFSKIN